MANMKNCRVCGKKYDACKRPAMSGTAFNYKEVACSPECGAEYIKQVMASRTSTSTVTTQVESSSVSTTTSTTIYGDDVLYADLQGVEVEVEVTIEHGDVDGVEVEVEAVVEYEEDDTICEAASGPESDEEDDGYPDVPDNTSKPRRRGRGH